MKLKTWDRPVGRIERFSANESVSACNPAKQVYVFHCDAGEANTLYDVYLNGSDGVAHTNDDEPYSRNKGTWFHPGKTVEYADTKDEFENGYMYKVQEVNGKWIDTGDPIDVIVWTQGHKHTHCTTNLNIEQWAKTRS